MHYNGRHAGLRGHRGARRCADFGGIARQDRLARRGGFGGIRGDCTARRSADMHQGLTTKTPLELTLLRRGHVPRLGGREEDLLLPLEHLTGLEGDPRRRFYVEFGRASFCKVARRLTSARGQAVPVQELRGMCGARVEQFLEYLRELQIVETSTDAVRLIRPVDNIGPTLEWYVAMVCEQELAGSASWSVKLEGPPAGGDYDVLTWLDPVLMYIETKSAPRTEVTDDQLRNFLQRAEELAADASVLLVDTNNVTPALDRISAILTSIFGEQGVEPYIAPTSDYPGVSYGLARIYVTGTDPSVATQIRRCVQHYHVRVRGVFRWERPRVNFITGEQLPQS